jgi:hypothetical protein
LIVHLFVSLLLRSQSNDNAGFRDLESTYAAAEKAAVADDSVRPAVRLALALQRDLFPYVSVLEEGYPKFIEQLGAVTGTFEPIVLNHDAVKWDKFLLATGRKAPPTRRNSMNKPGRSEIDSRSTQTDHRNDVDMGIVPIHGASGSGDHDSKHRLGPRITVKKKDPLTELEIAQMAYMVRCCFGVLLCMFFILLLI